MTRRIFAAVTMALGCTCAALAQKVGDLIPASNLGDVTYIQKPTLTPAGGQLVFSDSPETLTGDNALPGAMYRDRVNGQFRVFYHHQNSTTADVNIGVAITNSSAHMAILLGAGQGEGVSIYPDYAGQLALSQFFSSRFQLTLLAVLRPGETYWATKTVAPDETVSAIRQYTAITLPVAATSLPLNLLQTLQAGQTALPQGFGLGGVTVTTLAYGAARPADPLAVPVLAPDTHIRGTFPHFDRIGAFTVSASGPAQALAVDTAPPGEPWSDPMPGEYELGVDAVDGNTQVYNNGNYGVIYSFNVAVRKQGGTGGQTFGFLMQPTGGGGHYVMVTNGNLSQSPYMDYTSDWWYAAPRLNGPVTIVNVQTSLVGGSAGPQQLVFAPTSLFK